MRRERGQTELGLVVFYDVWSNSGARAWDGHSLVTTLRKVSQTHGFSIITQQMLAIVLRQSVAFSIGRSLFCDTHFKSVHSAHLLFVSSQVVIESNRNAIATNQNKSLSLSVLTAIFQVNLG